MSVQSSSLLNRRRVRRTFGKIKEVAQMPNLIEVQRNSYEQFLQMYVPSFDRTDVGLQAVFNSVFPINDFTVDLCWSLFLTHWKSQNMMLRNATSVD